MTEEARKRLQGLYIEALRERKEEIERREAIFRAVFFCGILDYADDELLEKASQWGLWSYDILERKNKLIQNSNATEDGIIFMYAVATARIVAEFGKFAFGYVLNEETEIKLHKMDLGIDDIEGFLRDNLGDDRIETLWTYNLVEQQDVWKALCELKSNICECLVETYAFKDKKHPFFAIYESLMIIFEELDEDGNIVLPYQAHYRENDAIQYVINGFSY